MFMIIAYGKAIGSTISSVNIQFSNYEKNISFPLNVQVFSTKLSDSYSLNAVNWAYLDSSLIRDNKTVAVKDILDHHINIMVIPPKFIPYYDPSTAMDFTKFESYLSHLKGFHKILLFMGFRNENRKTCNGKCKFMDEQWKTGFRLWYSSIVKAERKIGFSEDQIYLYPFDEMRGDEIDQFIMLSSWARKEIPGIKFFATLGEKNSQRALPYVDIAQVIDSDEFIKLLPKKSTELWIYNAGRPSKSLPPYSYYRLMPWKAFAYDFKGVGFWSYDDVGSSSAWNDFDGNYPDYAVIYEGDEGSIISSRRWEAWMMGIEDYELLAIYSKRKDDKKAKTLAKAVFAARTEVSRADEIRTLILRELSAD